MSWCSRRSRGRCSALGTKSRFPFRRWPALFAIGQTLPFGRKNNLRGETQLPNVPIVDANVVLRYLLDDHPELSEKARQALDSGMTTYVSTEVLCEIVYVLRSVYLVERAEIATTLGALVARPHLEFENRDVVRLALETYGLRSVDIVDALLFARNRIEGKDILTFDKTLQRLCRPTPA